MDPAAPPSNEKRLSRSAEADRGASDLRQSAWPGVPRPVVSQARPDPQTPNMSTAVPISGLEAKAITLIFPRSLPIWRQQPDLTFG